MIGLTQVYLLAGAVFAVFALLSARDASNPKRWSNTSFWGLLAISMLAGNRLGDFGNGLLVIVLVAITGLRGLGRGTAESAAEERVANAGRHGNRLFLLALVIPATALIGTFAFERSPDLVDPKQVTLVSLSLGAILAVLIGMLWLRPKVSVPFEEGRRLMDAVGWAGILPQMLASLGAVFALAGVGGAVGSLMAGIIPDGSLFGAVLAYGLGMALFTMVMGNAFAAFPVMTAAIGLPLLIRDYGGDPAIVCAIGMLAGFCGTLMTPMAANFNIVPAALLDLKDRNAVVKAQVPTALPLLAVNIALIYFLAFR
jgi:uncharacterized membrane protein